MSRNKSIRMQGKDVRRRIKSLAPVGGSRDRSLAKKRDYMRIYGVSLENKPRKGSMANKRRLVNPIGGLRDLNPDAVKLR